MLIRSLYTLLRRASASVFFLYFFKCARMWPACKLPLEDENCAAPRGKHLRPLYNVLSRSVRARCEITTGAEAFRGRRVARNCAHLHDDVNRTCPRLLSSQNAFKMTKKEKQKLKNLNYN